jgi:hypothetical protein
MIMMSKKPTIGANINQSPLCPKYTGNSKFLFVVLRKKYISSPKTKSELNKPSILILFKNTALLRLEILKKKVNREKIAKETTELSIAISAMILGILICIVYKCFSWTLVISGVQLFNAGAKYVYFAAYTFLTGKQ